VAAGGDGTVAQAVRLVAKRNVPLAVLPLGTANNIAFTLGLGGTLERQVQGWHDAPSLPLDFGALEGIEGPNLFVEGVGGGLVEACLTSFRRQPLRRGEPPPWQLVRALRRYAQTLARLRSRRWSWTIDGAARSEDLLLLEVMNTRAVGPNVEFAPSASASDGLLTVVTARESDRATLAAYIADRLNGRDARLELPSETARGVDLVNPQLLHVDDTLAHVPPGQTVSMRVQASAVSVLVPPPV
jgi:diacylglycerol kinase family enzyme